MRYRWAATHPLTTYLVSVAATDYESFSDTYTPIGGGSMPIKLLRLSRVAGGRGGVVSSATPAMMTHYAQLFGEYPFVEDQYGMSAFPFSGAMEHSTNTSYGYTLINGGHQYDYIIAHELAHQWWGDAVSPSSWPTSGSTKALRAIVKRFGPSTSAVAASYRSYMNSLWRASFSGPVYNNTNLFGTTIYNKGAWVQHMLRGVLGDPAFFQLLQTWYLTKRDASGNTAEYQATAEGIYGSSLDWFFQEWVYLQNSPTYQYGYRTANLGNGTYRNYVRIKQTQTNAGLFTMPVGLNLNTAGGPQPRTVWNNSLDQDFILDTTAPVTSISFDPLSWILKTGATSITLTDADSDGVPDRNDNCLNTANPTQSNFDLDAAGDACDADDDNDTLADGVDCAPHDAAAGLPPEVASLSVSTPGGGVADLSWTAAARADSYDVSRAAIHGLASGYGTCFASGVATTFLSDAEVPAPDEGFAYLVRGVDAACGGAGSAGLDSTGTARTLPARNACTPAVKRAAA